MEYGFFGLVVLVADIYALYHVFTSAASTGAKLLWTALIVILPLLGFLIWLVAGPRNRARHV